MEISLSKNLIWVILLGLSTTHYLDKMENLLNDTRKFEKINLKNDGKRVQNILKSFLRLIVYLKEQGDLLNQLGLGQV